MVATDVVQVPLAYAGLVVVFLLAAWELSDHSDGGRTLFAVIMMSGLLALFLSLRFRIARHAQTPVPPLDIAVFATLIVVALIVVLASVARSPGFITRSDLFPTNLEPFWGFGAVGVISLALANACWQFVDVSSLQRLQSVDLDDDHGDKRKLLQHGLFSAGIEAGGGWVLIILFALVLKWHGVTADTLRAYFVGHLEFGLVLLPLFVFAIVTFMLSTIDGLISTIAFVSYYDLTPTADANAGEAIPAETEEQEASILLRGPRAATALAITLMYLVFLFLRDVLETPIDGILYSFYAAQLSIGVVIVVSLASRGRTQSRTCAAIASVVAGWLGAVLTTVVWDSPRWGIHENSWYLVPPLAALVLSVLVYSAVAPAEKYLTSGSRGKP